MCYSFSKVSIGIWDWGLANFFWDYVINLNQTNEFSVYILPNYEKLEYFVETFIP
jgi:hypothetical protein